MIKGFEEETEELNEYEMDNLLPILVRKLPNHIGPEKAVKSGRMIEYIRDKGLNINGARIRKLINYIRRKNLVPFLIASSKGYYIANDDEDLLRFIESLEQREDAIRAVRISLQQQMKTKMNVELNFTESE